MAEAQETVSIRLLDNMAYGPDIEVPYALVKNCEVARYKGHLYYFEGVNKYGQRVFRLVSDKFRLDPNDNVAEIE
jgi:hypothetical protein